MWLCWMAITISISPRQPPFLWFASAGTCLIEQFSLGRNSIDAMSKKKQTLLSDFQQIPGVGKSISQDLWDMGYRERDDLRGQDPQEMYERLCTLRKTELDRCMLYVFRCAIYFVSEPKPDAALLKWWNWSDKNLKAPTLRLKKGSL